MDPTILTGAKNRQKIEGVWDYYVREYTKTNMQPSSPSE